MIASLLRVLRDDDGVALVEYGIITAAISAVAITALQMTGTSLNTLYSDLVSGWTQTANSGQ